MYTRLRGYARRYVAELPAPLKKYYLEYQRDFRRFREISSKRDLLREIEKSDLVFCGDYHTLAQAQRTVVRLLRDTVDRIKSREKEMILALEMVGPEHDSIIQNFLAGRIGESELAQAIRFEARWGFAWDNYRPLFELAKEKGLRIIGLNGKLGRGSSLEARDRFAAKILAGELATRPGASIFVLMGDLHLASNHLPAEVKKCLGDSGEKHRHTIIHQNHERLYWRFAENGRIPEVLRLEGNAFCVLNTSPWVKVQSHVSWAEKRSEGGGEDLGVDDEIEELVRVLAAFFEVPFRSSGDFTVLDAEEVNLLADTWAKNGHSPNQVERWRSMALAAKSTFFPAEKACVLKKRSFNQLASLASHYFHAKLAGIGRSFHRGPKDFYPSLWFEAIGYLGSKILNPKRKTEGLSENALGPKEVHHGRVLGEAIFAALNDGYVSLDEVRALFLNPFRNPTAARHLYIKWIRRLDVAGYRSFRKSDRL